MPRFERPGPTYSLDDARSRLRSSLHRLAPVSIPLDDALGAVLAEPVIAADDIPSFANAAMDGYAVRAADASVAPSVLRVVGRVLAGHPSSRPLDAGEAMVITTGAPLPEGADSVCMIEHAVLDGDDVVLEEVVKKGQHVRYPGEDIRRGSLVFEVGTELRPAHIGVLASLGVGGVAVFPKARVGVFSTGDELRSDPGPLEPGQIRDSNRHLLLALVRRAGGEPIDLGTLKDNETEIQRAVEAAVTTCDVVITSGGVSVGVADQMKTVLGRLSGGSLQWMEVAIKPAKPFGFATVGAAGVPVLCVPGNPVSALISFEILVRGALRFMMGHGVSERTTLPAIAAEDLPRRRDGKVHLIRVIVEANEDGLLARPVVGQGSHQLHATALANGFAILPDGDGAEAGTQVPVLLLDPEDLPATEVFR